MKNIPVADTRNFAIAGHTGSGKTTLTDALLFKLGLNDRLGSVQQGNSLADYTDEEKKHKITIFAKPFHATYKTKVGRSINLFFWDTPGYTDFFGQTIIAAGASDAVLLTVDATAGVQVGTQRAWKCFDKQGVPARGIVVTGLDKDNADFDKTFAGIQSAFGAKCVPVIIPFKTGVIDVLAAKDFPSEIAARAEELKGKLVEYAAETDDTLLEKFLAGQPLSAEEISKGLDVAIAKGSLVPVFAVAAIKDIGITELLEGISRLFPSPEDRVIHDLDGHLIKAGASEPLIGQVCRTVNDPFVGQIVYVRIYGGTLKADSEFQNSTKDHKERIASPLLLYGKKQVPVTDATAGDIVALQKLKATGMGDVICSLGGKVNLSQLTFPKPVTFMAINAKTQADEDKLRSALQRVCDDDPTLHVDRHAETHETVLQGLGDVHIDVVVEIMKNRSHVEVTLSTPRIPYRETVTGMGEGHYKHKKQSGGRGQYGDVYMKVQARPDENAETFVDAIVGGSIPRNFLPAIHKGCAEAMVAGPVAGYTVQNIQCIVYDGSFHEVDSSEIAFKIAGGRAFKEAMMKAKPVLLEPIMRVRITIPDHCMGDINGDMNHKRGRIMGMTTEDGLQFVEAEVPQAELFKYAAELRSMTAGQGTFEMEFLRFDTVPPNIAQKVIAAAAKDRKEEEED